MNGIPHLGAANLICCKPRAPRSGIERGAKYASYMDRGGVLPVVGVPFDSNAYNMKYGMFGLDGWDVGIVVLGCITFA